MKKLFAGIFLLLCIITYVSADWDKVDGLSIANIIASLTDASQKTQIVDGSGNVIGSLNNALNIHDADIHTKIITRHFIDFDSSTEAISSVSAGDTVLLVASTTGFTTDDDVVLKDSGGDVREHHFVVGAVVADTSIALNRPVDIAYATGTIEEVIVNMNVDGSGSTLIYEIAPPSDEVWHITRMLISATDTSVNACTDDNFVTIGALTNGVILRENKSVLYTIEDWKSNDEMKLSMFDLVCSPSPPAGVEGVSGRFTFEKAKVIVRLDGSLGETLQILIQDDLTDLLTLIMKAQGHIEE